MTEPRTYASLATARKAIKAKDLDEEPVRYDAVFVDGRTERRIMPVVIVGTVSDRQEVEDLGFKAEMRAERYHNGSTVCLHPSIQADRHDELATIKHFWPERGLGSVELDRPLGGTKWWTIEDLVLV